MDKGRTGLIVAAFATFFNNALHWYTQVSTYPLFEELKEDAFVPYHQAYERRLPLAIYAPYIVLMVASFSLLFRRPKEIGRAPIIALNVINASIMASSLALAAPIHAKLDRKEIAQQEGASRLVRLNLLRLAASTASSGIMLSLLIRLLRTHSK